MSESEEKTEVGEKVPPFVQIVAAVSNAFGRGEEDVLVSDVLYGLDGKGRVWQWVFADPDRKGAAEGWRLLPNTMHVEGAEPVPQRKTR
jgi:hypothetical protein